MSDREQQPPIDVVESPFTQPDRPEALQRNGEVDGTSQDDSAGGEEAERPNKRRRLTESFTPQQQQHQQQRPSPRAVSPPWRKFGADGPTTFIDPNGKRRSGRTNALPLDLQPASAKRRTRASAQQTSTLVKNRYSSTPKQDKQLRESASQTRSASRHTRNVSKTSQGSAASKTSRRYSLYSRRDSLPSTPIRSGPSRKSGDGHKSSPQESPRSSRRQRRPSSRALDSENWSTGRRPSRYQNKRPQIEQESEEEEEDSDAMTSSLDEDSDLDNIPTDPNVKTPKLRFKVTRPTLGTPSYGNTLQFARETRTLWTKRQFSSLEEWLAWAVEHGHQVFPGYDIYEGDEEYLKEVMDDNEERKRHKETSKQIRPPVVPLTTAHAWQEARTRQEVEEALQPGGRLHPDTSTQLAPEKFDLGRRQYAHWDHLIAHALNFRRLLFKEQKAHREAARRLAYAAQEKWKAIQPKSQEEIDDEKEEAEKVILSATMRQCIRDLTAKWDLIRAELDKLRLVRWQEEQEALGKKALNKVMEQSAQLLDARRRLETSEMGSDTEESVMSEGDDDMSPSDASDSDNTDAGGEEQAENMSSSGSDSEESTQGNAVADESLTVEQLRRKYAEAAIQNLDRPPDESDDDSKVRPSYDPPVNSSPRRMPLGKGESPQISLPVDDSTSFAQVPELDEAARKMYEAMSEDSDESIDMSEEDSSDDSGEDDDEQSSDDDSDENTGLGLFSLVATKTQLKEAKAQLSGADKIKEEDQETPSFAVSSHTEDDSELEEVSLIPDAAQVQTPAASNDEGGPDSYRQEQPKDRPSNLSIVMSTSPKPATPEPDPTDQDVTMDIQEAMSMSVQEDYGESTEQRLEKAESEICDDQEMTDKPREVSPPPTPVSTIIKTPVPSLLRATLREYQHYGLDWLAGLYAKDTNGILADEMGLGKTIQTISLLAHVAEVHGIWGPHLIVVPTSVMLNWEIEFKKFLPGFKVLVYYGTPEERKNKRKGWLDDDKWNVVITSYQLVLQDQASFKRRGWHYMVLDEAHNIKNWKSARWQTLLGFRTSHRLLLTGTPLQNNLTELWSLMFFLMPYSEDESGRPQFTGLEEFTAWFNKPVNQIMEQGRGELTDEARELVKRLHTILRPYILRRLKADVEKQMPAKHEHVVYCKLSKRQRHLYDGFMSRASTRETLASGNYLSIINCLMQLRKVCNHPDLFETRQIVTSYAMPKSAVAEFEIKDLLVRRRLLVEDQSKQVDLRAVNLLMPGQSSVSALDTIQNRRVGAQLRLTDMVRKHFELSQKDMPYDASSIDASLKYMRNQAHQAAAEKLDSQWNMLKMRSQERPLIKQQTVDFIRRKLSECRFTEKEYAFAVPQGDITALQRLERKHALPLPSQPQSVREYAKWLDYCTPVLKHLTPTVAHRANEMRPFVKRFGCITPAVVAHGIDVLACGKPGIEAVNQLRSAPGRTSYASIEPFHEAQTRLSIAFPDKRLLQYDCGKLQRLDILLRTLQAGGHRALIFTQMTKVLDILEQFLNIHGHRYLRLDGSTKIEQRQILTDRFNNDTRILAFILSSRSGGLGINLTGADTVIFYDLDWNPAMDKQCQDRCHRIGQTRDVHIYRLVSEYTIEANILRKANQKRLLDDVIIQDGDFTTDHFNNPNPRDVEEDDAMHEADAEASAAMDRVLGGGPSGPSMSTKLLASAEDKEDIAAAANAEKEGRTDDADFDEKTPGTSTRADTPKTPGPILAPGSSSLIVPADGDHTADFFSGVAPPRTENAAQVFADKAGIGVDRYILEYLEWELKDVPNAPPDDRKIKKKRGRKPADYSTKRRR